MFDLSTSIQYTQPTSVLTSTSDVFSDDWHHPDCDCSENFARPTDQVNWWWILQIWRLSAHAILFSRSSWHDLGLNYLRGCEAYWKHNFMSSGNNTLTVIYHQLIGNWRITFVIWIWTFRGPEAVPSTTLDTLLSPSDITWRISFYLLCVLMTLISLSMSRL